MWSVAKVGNSKLSGKSPQQTAVRSSRLRGNHVLLSACRPAEFRRDELAGCKSSFHAPPGRMRYASADLEVSRERRERDQGDRSDFTDATWLAGQLSEGNAPAATAEARAVGAGAIARLWAHSCVTRLG